MSNRNLQDLHPDLLITYREWVMRCHNAGLAIKAIDTWRSPDEQDAAKASGKSKAGAGESPHNCCDKQGNPASKAFDFAVFDGDGHYVTDGMDDRYRTAGEIGKDLGLEWGGDWPHFKDWDHLELSNWRGV